MTGKAKRGIVFAVVWCLLFLALLLFSWVQRDIDDMPVAAVLFAAGLSLPAGPAAIALVGTFYGDALRHYAIPDDPFRDFLCLWATSAFVVYLQWFCIFPKLVLWTISRFKTRANE